MSLIKYLSTEVFLMADLKCEDANPLSKQLSPKIFFSSCKTIKYLKELPTTSVVIIFYNELTSLLLRTVHSVYNRTPRELLHEILLVNDCSTKEELYEPLQSYVRDNFDGRVKIVNLKERKGLIVARMEGARRATGEVLLFLDAHMEVQ